MYTVCFGRGVCTNTVGSFRCECEIVEDGIVKDVRKICAEGKNHVEAWVKVYQDKEFDYDD